MSKRISHGVVLAICLLGVSCSGQPSSPPKASTEPSAPQGQSQTAAAPAAAEPEVSAADRLAGAKWTGDLDGMITRRVIRVLTTYSKVNDFVDKATQRGLVYDAFRLFEDDLNKKLKTKNLRVQVRIVPVAHEDLIPALLDGRGDIVAAGTLLTDGAVRGEHLQVLSGLSDGDRAARAA